MTMNLLQPTHSLCDNKPATPKSKTRSFRNEPQITCTNYRYLFPLGFIIFSLRSGAMRLKNASPNEKIFRQLAQLIYVSFLIAAGYLLLNFRMRQMLAVCLILLGAFTASGQCPTGNITLTTQTEVDNFISGLDPACNSLTVTGNLVIGPSSIPDPNLDPIDDLSGFSMLTAIEGSLYIRNTNRFSSQTTDERSVFYYRTIETEPGGSAVCIGAVMIENEMMG
jgi:hypothetical protein